MTSAPLPLEIPTKANILLVDDEDYILSAINIAIKDIYNVTSCCRSSIKALEFMQTNEYHILITDLLMQEMMGMELIKEAKILTPSIIPIILTGYSSKDTALEAFKEGVFDLIEKPIKKDILLNSLDRAWSKRLVEIQNEILIRDLKLASEKAKVAINAKSDFISTLSHEIRTPLNGVLGAVSILEETPLNTEQRDWFNTLRISADSLMDVINDILDFSKIEEGKLQLETLDFNLRDCIKDTIAISTCRIENKPIEFISYYPEDLNAYVKSDPGRIRQILNNLISNAVEFTDQGKIEIRVESLFETKTNQTIKVSIQDHGIGISDENQLKLFQPFSQVDQSTSRMYGGTGLGLTICKRLVELMNGEIGLESKQGEGSTFWFTLSYQKPISSTIVNTTDKKSSLTGKAILLVDDSSSMRRLASSYLEQWGCIVDTAKSGSNALECINIKHAKDEIYDLIITDLIMGKMDGWELGSTIKAMKEYKDRPVILFTTSSSLFGDKEKADKIGFHSLVSKPLDEVILHKAIISAFSKSSVSKENETTDEPKKTLRILVVEDNSVNMMVAKYMIKHMGHKCDASYNGKEALNLFGKFKYDLILMDIQMPKMNGLDATKAIREIEANKSHVPIIALSAGISADSTDLCFEAGMDDYLSKPIKTEHLVAAIRKWS